ncbi:MAG: hypothetical protein CMK64_05160 [Pseudoalteromonas sp.]|nr:hypothetical protein [Pseudoalteromonas sp.]|tara:strand:- start:42797 stop:43117 length:321 start_codon:yes stop_codon:yes gene_type:complete
MNIVIRLIIISFIFLVFGCSSSGSDRENFTRAETLEERIKRNSHKRHIVRSDSDLASYRSFNDGNLRLENPELEFMYFPERGKSSMSSTRKVRFSMYEFIHYRKGF